MRYSVKFTHTEDELLRAMAKEAGVSTSSLLEIAAYNLIAIWIKERNNPHYIESDDPNIDPLSKRKHFVVVPVEVATQPKG